MTTASFTGPPSILEHDLNKHFPELLKFNSTPEMEASELYREIHPEVERIMNAVVSEPPASAVGTTVGIETTQSYGSGLDAEPVAMPPAHAGGSDIHALAWNLERGIKLDGILNAFKSRSELQNKDVLLLTELDHGMARSGNRFVAQEIARELNL